MSSSSGGTRPEETWNTGVDTADDDVVLARTGGEAGDGDGITAFLVPTDAAGFEVLEYLGTFNMPTDHAHIRLTDVIVDGSAVFGGLGRRPGVVQHFFNENRIRQAASSLGAAAARPGFPPPSGGYRSRHPIEGSQGGNPDGRAGAVDR